MDVSPNLKKIKNGAVGVVPNLKKLKSEAVNICLCHQN